MTMRRPFRPFGRANIFLAILVLLGQTLERAFAGDEPQLVPPVVPACISSPFGARVLADRPLAGRFHPGIDLPAPLGAPVRAVAPGTIIRVQKHGLGGLEMLVQHAGFVGVYSHLGLIAPVILNGKRTVAAGDKVGTVGRSGLTYGPHLYFGMLVDGRPINPAPYLGIPACGTNASLKSEDAPIRPPRS
jgi:murein DD-endopeptidase MepM/ murein hydrolase activator NlpD